MIHFNRFLEVSINTKTQENAYNRIIKFLDEVPPLEISDDIMVEFEQAMDFWTDEKLLEVENKKLESIENPEKFLEEQSQIIKRYRVFKDSNQYKNSSYEKITSAMRQFAETSGYNEVFIPSMRKLSPSYEDYYQKLVRASEVFIEKTAENSKWKNKYHKLGLNCFIPVLIK